MNARTPLAVALLSTSLFAVGCGRPAGPLRAAPDELHLRAHGEKGQIVLNESDYGGLYYKTTDSDPHCAATVAVTPEPRHRGEPAHVDVVPQRPGTCDIYFFDDHNGRRRVAVVVAPN